MTEEVVAGGWGLWTDRFWLSYDAARGPQVTLLKPPRGIRAVEYGKFLSKEALFKLASQDDGMDTGRYVNNLLRIIDNQTREINRLRQANSQVIVP